MSIYPVKLSEWFPVGDEHFFDTYEIIRYTKCFACGKRLKFKSAVGHHSIPWGNGDIWCSWKCCKSGKKFKFDKRQRRSFNRRFGKTVREIKSLILELP